MLCLHSWLDLIGFLFSSVSQAYGSGCDVVILASDFDCVQIIPGAQNGNIQVGCVECSHQLGRVSVDRPSRPILTKPVDIIVYSEHTQVQLSSCIVHLSLSPPPPLSFWSWCAVALMGWVMGWWAQLFIFRLLPLTETQSASLNLWLPTQTNAIR